MINIKKEHSQLITYAADIPATYNPVGEVSITKPLLLGVDLQIEYISTTINGDAGFTGYGGDYDILIHSLATIRRAMFGVTSNNKDIIDIRSDTLYFLDCMFNAWQSHVDTAPAAILASASYYIHLFVPLKLTNAVGSYRYQFDLATEAQFITTAANHAMTSIEFTFNNVYCDMETWNSMPTMKIKDYNTGQINSTDGVEQRSNLDEGQVMIGSIISGEHAGAEDLDHVYIANGEDVKIDVDKIDYEGRHLIVTHGKAPFNNNWWDATDPVGFCNLMCILHEPFRIDAQTSYKIATIAAQDYQVTLLYQRDA